MKAIYELQTHTPQMFYELLECNDKQNYIYNLEGFDLYNLFQLYRNNIGSPVKYVKMLKECGYEFDKIGGINEH